MDYNNPELPLQESPVLLDAAVQRFQILLKDKLPWLQAAYGLSRNAHHEDGAGKTVIMPEVYAGNGQYVIVLPNNFFYSMCFFAAKGSAKALDYDGIFPTTFEQEIEIVFWVNLVQLATAMQYSEPPLQRLIGDVLKALKMQTDLQVKNYETDARQVWQGWGLDLLRTQTFKHPEAGFKLTCTLTYSENC